MAWGVRWYLVGSIVLGVLGVLAGCSGGNFFAEREPWRHEAEVQCINAGTVKEGAGVVRVRAIRGPGVCGADFPLKVSILGESAPLGYADDLRPPGDIPRSAGSAPARWPIRPSSVPAPAQEPPPPYQSRVLARISAARGRPDRPISRCRSIRPTYRAKATARRRRYDFRRPYGASPPAPSPTYRPPSSARSPRDDFSPEPYERRPLVDAPGVPRNSPGGITRTPLRPPPLADAAPAATREAAPTDIARGREPPPVVPLGPAADAPIAGAVAPVAVSPAATLACPMVSELDRWITGAVQPAALRWFGSPVAEITQISAYSCRGMNGNPRAHISEHAFGNALDIAAFTLADGRKITVKNGWRGLPEEQGFLRDVQGAACDQFTTVLAPGSNVFHYDHIHVDLMRRRDGHRACNPRAVSGEEVAARAGGRYAGKRAGEPAVTGSLAPRGLPSAEAGASTPTATTGSSVRSPWPSRATTARTTELGRPASGYSPSSCRFRTFSRSRRPKRRRRKPRRPGTVLPQTSRGTAAPALRHHAAPLKMSPWDTNMCRPNRTASWEELQCPVFASRPLLAFCAMAAVLAFAVTDADARAGRGGSFGSRGSQTFSAPPRRQPRRARGRSNAA